MRSLPPCTLAVLGCLLAGSQAWPQQEPAPRDTVRASPAAVPEPEIPRRAVQDLAHIAAMRSRLAPDSSLTVVRTELPALSRTTPEPPSDSVLARLTIFQLQALRDEHEPRRRQLDRWLRQLEGRSQRLSAVADTVGELQHVWQITFDSISQRRSPAAVRERIRGVIATADSVTAEANRRIAEVLTLLDQVSLQTSASRELVGRIDAAARAARTRLLEPDSPPLWKVTLGAGDTSMAARISAAWTARAGNITRFAADNWSRVGLHWIAYLTVLAVLLSLRRGIGSGAALDHSLRAPVHILHHPFAAAALLVLIATRRFYEDVPFAVSSLLIIVGLLIVVWLLRGLVPRWQRAPMYGLAVLVLYGRERLVAPEGTLLHRVLLLAGTIGAFVAFAWFALALRREAVEHRGWQLATILLTRASVVLLAISILANIFGLVILADLLDTGVIWSSALALLLTTGVLIAHGVIVIGMRTNIGQRLQIVRHHEQAIATASRGVIRLLAAVWWTILALSAFEAFSPLRAAVMGFLTRSRSLGSIEFRVGDWLLFGVTLWAAVWLSRIVRHVLDEDVLPRLDLRRGVAGLVSALTRYVLVGLGLLLGLGAAGIELNQLAFVAGALGVGIGFGLQNIVSNFVSGLVLLFERPVQAGDIIELENLFGEVKRIGVRSSTVRTFQGAEVIVPNASLITTNVINWTLSDRLRRIEVDVGVAYGTDPTRVRDLLLQVAKANPDVLVNPEAQALFEGFGDSSLNFSLRCWTGAFDRFVAIRSDLRTAIWAALKEAGIEIPFPQRDLHIKSVAPAAGATLKPSNK